MHGHTPQVSTSAQAPLLLGAWAKVGMYQNEVICLVRHIVTYVNQVEYNNMYKGVTLCDFLQLYLYIKIKV
jgi:subtilase family serine protease